MKMGMSLADLHDYVRVLDNQLSDGLEHPALDKILSNLGLLDALMRRPAADGMNALWLHRLAAYAFATDAARFRELVGVVGIKRLRATHLQEAILRIAMGSDLELVRDEHQARQWVLSIEHAHKAHLACLPSQAHDRQALLFDLVERMGALKRPVTAQHASDLLAVLEACMGRRPWRAPTKVSMDLACRMVSHVCLGRTDECRRAASRAQPVSARDLHERMLDALLAALDAGDQCMVLCAFGRYEGKREIECVARWLLARDMIEPLEQAIERPVIASRPAIAARLGSLAAQYRVQRQASGALSGAPAMRAAGLGSQIV